MTLTQVEFLQNKSSDKIEYSDSEGKGHNLTGKNALPPSTLGAVGAPVPWWYSPLNTDFDKHHMKVHSHEGDTHYYVWQHEDKVYYKHSKPPEGKYTDGTVLCSVGGHIALILDHSGLSAKYLYGSGAEYVAAMTVAGEKIIQDYKTFSKIVYKAMKDLNGTSAGTDLISDIAAAVSPTSFNGTNYVKKVLATPQLSPLGLEPSGDSQASSSGKPSYETMSVGVGGDFGAVFAASQTVGVVWDFKGSCKAYYSATVSAVPSPDAGASGIFELGFWNTSVTGVGGLSYSLSEIYDIGLGEYIAVYTNSSFECIGFQVGVAIGADIGIVPGIGATAII